MANIDSKRNGRFIKKGDPLHKVLSITDFSLSDICDSPITFHDNAMANIIHEKLHLREELAETIRASHEIETVFQNQEERMLIRPLDFTDEWNRMRKRQSSRNMRTDEDDDFDLEAVRAEEAQQDADDLAAFEKRTHEDGEPAPEPEKTLFAAPPVVESKAAPLSSPAPEPIIQSPYTTADAAVPPSAPAPAPAPLDDFVPYAQTQGNAGHSSHVSTPERFLSEEELEQLRSEAREEGFRQGFQSGEERATLESRHKVQSILEEVSNIVGNLEGMQKSILNHAQSNFHAITKSFIESMLHKEFSMSPEVFGAVMERAINEGLGDDEFKIFVSPKVAKDLKTWSNEKLQSRIRSDDAIQDYDFRIEGQHASIDASIPKIISDLLDQADLNLFEHKEKVG